MGVVRSVGHSVSIELSEGGTGIEPVLLSGGSYQATRRVAEDLMTGGWAAPVGSCAFAGMFAASRTHTKNSTNFHFCVWRAILVVPASLLARGAGALGFEPSASPIFAF
jgi:hypothetical protein